MVALTIGARIRVHGLEHVQPGPGYVYMANHSSLIDTPALFAYLPYQFKIMAKRSLFYVPFLCRRRSWLPWPGPVDVFIGEPIPTDGAADEGLHAFIERTKQAIRSKLTP